MYIDPYDFQAVKQCYGPDMARQLRRMARRGLPMPAMFHEAHETDSVPTNVVVEASPTGDSFHVEFRRLLAGCVHVDRVECSTLAALRDTIRRYDPTHGIADLTPQETRAARQRYRRRVPRLLTNIDAARDSLRRGH
jgi:hypothetical protein